MKVLQINTVYGEGSTGKIAAAIHDACKARDIECITAHRCFRKGQAPLADSISVSSKWDSRLHGWLARFTMFKGAGSFFRTAAFLKRLRCRYMPDVIHLHNLHGSYINLPLLFRFIRRHRIPVVWTLHDCWAFTAICSHFSMASCDKWKTGCNHCPQRKKFSSAPADFTPAVWKTKKAWFCSLQNAVLVTPSDWLSGLAGQSFLGKYPVRTIHNGIDLQVFSPTESDFRIKHGLEDRKIVLGAAFDWNYGKGLDVFIRLSQRLGREYRIVLVGTNAQVDAGLPENILSIHRTHDQAELAQIYSAADVFVNPTREEVFGLVNIEALACGTPVITFNAGGSPECVDSSCGVVVELNDADAVEREIRRICTLKPYSRQACRERALHFSNARCINAYIELYREAAAEQG